MARTPAQHQTSQESKTLAKALYPLDKPVTEAQVEGLRAQSVAEVRLALVAAGGEYQKDCEDVLISHGSRQDDVRGTTWIRTTKTVEFVSVINIRPRSGRWTMELRDEVLRARIGRIVRKYMEAV